MKGENMESNFVKLAAIDVSKHVEKKQNLSYLSWAWAVDQLMRADPAANWEFHEPKMYGETMMVSCTVTAFGKPMTMHLPVMDHRNQAIKNPDAFQVNKNMMRCLVKAIAVHGLGLYIYAGEDLPASEEPAKPSSAKPIAKDVFDSMPPDEQEFLKELAMKVIAEFPNEEAAYAAYIEASINLDADEKTALWSLFDSKQRASIKKTGLTQQKAA